MWMVYWEVDGASGGTLVAGSLEQAQRHFDMHYKPYGYVQTFKPERV